MKIVKKNQLKIVIFTAVKNRCILHGRVFVMVRISVFDCRVCPMLHNLMGQLKYT